MSKVYRDTRGDWDELVIEDGADIATAKLSEVGEALGFTWEDVDALRSVARWDADVPDNLPRLESLADRIETLLPPREGP